MERLERVTSMLRRRAISLKRGGLIAAAAIGLTMSGWGATAARAEASQIRIANQPSFTFLQLNVMAHQNLIEKHAAALGIPNLKVQWIMFTRGADAMNDGLLSGALDVGTVGVNSLLIAWSKTVGTPLEIRGVSGLGHFALVLNTRNPAIKSITDFTPDNKIAVPGVKSSAQALILEMAAAKQWGIANYDRLDAQTFTMAVADQTAAILSGNNSVESAFASPPFTLMQLRDPKVHTVLSSTDLIGNNTSAILYSTKSFHDANPTIYKAMIEALKEADAFIHTNLRDAVGYYIEDVQSKDSADTLVDMLSRPDFGYALAPTGMMTYADFMSKTGRIQKVPASWKDLFFPEIYDLPGN